VPTELPCPPSAYGDALRTVLYLFVGRRTFITFVCIVHTGQKRPISEGPGKGLRTGPGGPAAGDAVAQRLGRLPAAPEWQRIDFGSNRAPLGTRSPLNNAQMMRCSTSQTLAGL
jgi:hypothetical protein